MYKYSSQTRLSSLSHRPSVPRSCHSIHPPPTPLPQNGLITSTAPPPNFGSFPRQLFMQVRPPNVAKSPKTVGPTSPQPWVRDSLSWSPISSLCTKAYSLSSKTVGPFSPRPWVQDSLSWSRISSLCTKVYSLNLRPIVFTTLSNYYLEPLLRIRVYTLDATV